jgi:NADPH:quinone reductase
MVKVRAVVAARKGGPEVLEEHEIDLGWPAGPRDVLVRLRAAALNPADCFFRQLGGYIDAPGPLVLGHDGAGTVEDVGSEVERVKRGEPVAFCNGGIGGTPGTYAEYAIVPESQLAQIPGQVSFETAAALPLVSITAWEALHERAALRSGEFALIHAGAGGTGHVALQLARLAGARIATTVSTAEKAAFARQCGAEFVIDYRAEDFVEAAGRWTAGRGVDVALDNAGADVLQRTYACMAPYGRVVTLMGIAADDASTSAYNANLTLHCLMMLTPMWRRLTGRLAEQAEIVRRCLALAAEKRLAPHISTRFPLARAAEAHAMLEAGGTMGKIVLSTDD